MGSEASLEEALDKLEQLWKETSALHYTCQMMEIVVLQALAYHGKGQSEKAMEVLEQAVAMGMPGGWIRPFVELGPPMADLLKRLTKQDVAVGYIKKILGAFDDQGHGAAPDVPGGRRAAGPLHTSEGLIEPLTNREEEILELLGERLRDKEIADKLFISASTVKSHVKHVYEKLHVSSRREAVARATAWGILTQG
jgi:LuxR family maltose regulon positive regulatory protein